MLMAAVAALMAAIAALKAAVAAQTTYSTFMPSARVDSIAVSGMPRVIEPSARNTPDA